jgi:hypothetical protein
MNLIPAKDFPLRAPEGLPAKQTLYQWHSIKKYPALLLKVGSKLYFDMDEWEAMARRTRDRQVEEAQQLRQEPCNA